MYVVFPWAGFVLPAGRRSAAASRTEGRQPCRRHVGTGPG